MSSAHESERMRKALEVVEAAFGCPTDERLEFIQDRCADDSDLRREVEKMLTAAQDDSFLRPELLNSLAGELLSPPPLMPGQHIGPYKVLREIGRGGMGTVFLAARADDQYQKRVAIKLIKRGMDSDEISARFRHERQILAALDNPNIARLLHGDTTADGLPYFVMEYVEGEPIDVYCDTHKLSTVERLHLFRKVCTAVSYAHNNLVVHRDLKPGNILVTKEGDPKLLDFGIAKFLNPEMSSQTIALTGTIMRPMTPEYASPEQVRGQPITTASDVYSLGVLLYELLTGHRPYRVRGSSAQEIERVICEQDPEPPSTAVGRTENRRHSDGSYIEVTPEIVSRAREDQPDKLKRRLSGDLDNIVLMAMRKEPQRRYQSVEQFSEDIRHHLEGLPVLARKSTFAYRASKFIGRHRIGVAVALVLMVLIVGFAITARVQSARTARERDKAQRVSAFLVDLFKVSDPSQARGNTVTAREILDKGAERVQRELQDEPEVQATLMHTIGMVYRSLGLYDKAMPLLQDSLNTRRRLFGGEGVDVAESLNDLGWVWLDKQDGKEAEPLLREALEMRRKFFGAEHPTVAESMNLLAQAVKLNGGDSATTERLFRDSLAMRRKLLGAHIDTAQSLNNLGLFLLEQGKDSEAEPLIQEAVDMDRRLLGDEHPEIGILKNNLALVKLHHGDLANAESLYREVLALDRKLFGKEHQDTTTTLNNLAETLRDEGKYEEAEPLYHEAIDSEVKIGGSNTWRVAAFGCNLAKSFYGAGDFARAEPLARDALATFRRVSGDQSTRTANCAVVYGLILAARGDKNTPEQILRQALETQRRLFPQGHRSVATALVALAQVLTERGQAQESEGLAREALSMRQKLGVAQWQIVEAASVLGGCLVSLGRFDEAEPLLNESYLILKNRRAVHDVYTTDTAARLAELHRARGKSVK